MSPLSKKETLVVKALHQFRTNKEIASELNVSVNTVKTHLRHIFKKLNVHTRTELVIKLQQEGNITQIGEQ